MSTQWKRLEHGEEYVEWRLYGEILQVIRGKRSTRRSSGRRYPDFASSVAAEKSFAAELKKAGYTKGQKPGTGPVGAAPEEPARRPAFKLVTRPLSSAKLERLAASLDPKRTSSVRVPRHEPEELRRIEERLGCALDPDLAAFLGAGVFPTRLFTRQAVDFYPFRFWWKWNVKQFPEALAQGLWCFASDTHGSTWCWKSHGEPITTSDRKRLKAPKGAIVFWSGESGIESAVAAKSFLDWLNRVARRAT